MFSSLSSKFIVPAVLIVSGIIGASAWMTFRTQRSFLMELDKDRMKAFLKSVELDVIDLMLNMHGNNLQKKMERMAPNDEITAIRIFNSRGIVSKSSNRSELGKTLKDLGLESRVAYGRSSALEFWRDGKRSLGVADPIVNRESCHSCHSPSQPDTGLLFVEASLSRRERQVSSLGKQAFISTFLTIAVLSLALWLLLIYLVTRPVRIMIRRMGKAQGGDLSALVRSTRRDELGTLARTYNSMLERLSTARKELESLYRQQIQRADRLASLGELASSIAHEIKNPLGGISGAIQILREDYHTGDTRRGVLEEILRQIQRLDKTTKDLLSFARPSPPLLGMTNINSVIEKALLLVEPQAKKQRVEIITHLDSNLPNTMADEEQIQQCLLNLCLNGVQAMPDGGQLIVKTEARYFLMSEIILITIQDTGTGIPQEHMSRIFEPFYTTKAQGTGLGLSIARSIVEGHGGGIFVESNAGKGTIFYVRLPVRGPAVMAEAH